MARETKHPPGVTTVLRFRAHGPTPNQMEYLERCAAGYHAAWNHSVAIQRAATKLFGEARSWIDKDGVEHIEHDQPRLGSKAHAGMAAYTKLARRLRTFKAVSGGFTSQSTEMPWESVPAQILQFAMSKLDDNWSTYWGHIKHGRYDAKPPGFRKSREATPFWGMPSQRSSSSPLDTPNIFRTESPYPKRAGMPGVSSPKAAWVRLPSVQKRAWKIGQDEEWVRVIAHRPVPEDARVTNQAWSFTDGHWWCLLAINQPVPTVVPELCDQPVVVGVDRGVNKSAFTFAIEPTTGEVVSDRHFPRTPGLNPHEKQRLRLLQRSLARKHHQNSPGCFDEQGDHIKGRCEWRKSGAASRGRAKKVADEIAKLRAREARRRKEHVEQQSRFLVETADVIAFENLDVKSMMKSAKGSVGAPGKNVKQKKGLNRSIGEQSWAAIQTRTKQKAALEAVAGREVRVVEVPAPYTSRKCSACSAPPKKANRKGGRFLCVDCGYSDDADRNAAKNIALLAIGQLRSDGTLTDGGSVGSILQVQSGEGRPVCDGALDGPETRVGDHGAGAATVTERAS